MEMEKVNENTIRVLLGTEDLTERGITVLDLLGNQKEIENFFFSILEEVDKDHEFRDNEAVTFQLIPNQNGLELFITKVDPNQAESTLKNISGNQTKDQTDDQKMGMPKSGITNDLAEYIRKQLSADDQKDQVSGKKSLLANSDRKTRLKDEVSHRYLVSFAEFEDFIQLAKSFECDDVISNLYRLDGKYYLELVFFVDQLSPTDIKNAMALVYEFSVNEPFDPAVIKERGQCLMEQAALEMARYHFK
ncbi:adaptor protein MecA [Ligilactobacillus faecis]|uniref:Adapter protein MecA n=1 Tax=Ligilactobacillus faecis TaxID=762833 RepID=A0ABV4DPX1_9LACO|nr:adaptor protein MecA [Ligilactobacillus faecis]WGN88894.1 adaptor protein MecA [Ligilactobacillus faecis]